jgi:hypothetical protein
MLTKKISISTFSLILGYFFNVFILCLIHFKNYQIYASSFLVLVYANFIFIISFLYAFLFNLKQKDIFWTITIFIAISISTLNIFIICFKIYIKNVNFLLVIFIIIVLIIIYLTIRLIKIYNIVFPKIAKGQINR